MRAALDLAEEQGVRAATFNAIGERAGYSRGLASQHFGSKRGLIAAVIEHLHAEMEENVRSVIENEALSGFDALEGYVEATFRAFRAANTYRAYFTFLSGAVAEKSALLPLFEESHQRVKRSIAELIERGRVDGGVDPGADPEAGALLVGSLLMGVSIQSLIDPKLDLEAMERQAKAILCAGFRARK